MLAAISIDKLTPVWVLCTWRRRCRQYAAAQAVVVAIFCAVRAAVAVADSVALQAFLAEATKVWIDASSVIPRLVPSDLLEGDLRVADGDRRAAGEKARECAAIGTEVRDQGIGQIDGVHAGLRNETCSMPARMRDASKLA